MAHLEIKSQGGPPVYYASFRDVQGKRRMRAIGPVWGRRGRPAAGSFSEGGALLEMERIIEAHDASLRAAEARQEAQTVGAAADRWLEHCEVTKRLSKSTLSGYRSVVKNDIRPAFGDALLGELSSQAIEHWKTQASSRLGARSINKTLINLGSIYVFARKVLGYAGPSPVERVDKLKETHKGDIRYFTVEEARALARAAATDQLATLLLTAVMTGMRKGELLALRWGSVDFSRQTIFVRRNWVQNVEKDTKGGRMRSIPLSPELAMSLARLRNRDEYTEDGDLVFVGYEGNHIQGDIVYDDYIATRNAAGLTPLTFHELRHTFGTTMATAGADLWDIKAWMGHADISTTQIYLHWSPKAKGAQEIFDAFNEKREADHVGLPPSAVTSIAP